uniref:Uncharacterized protein n=1 Tax=Anopheles funestus TaxID=62324 RepID=A0A4Y0BGK6_ANOFN
MTVFRSLRFVGVRGRVRGSGFSRFDGIYRSLTHSRGQQSEECREQEFKIHC